MTTTVITGQQNIETTVKYGSLSNAITALGGAGLTTLLVTEPSTVSTNTTIPSNIILKIPSGNILTISGGTTLTVNGKIEANRYQIFAGSGTVTVDSSVTVYPDWWGALSNLNIDSLSAFTAALASGSSYIDVAPGNYYVSARIPCSFPTVTRRPVTMVGYGATLHRKVTDAVASPIDVDCVLYFNNEHEYSTTATANIFLNATQITVADTGSMSPGDPLFIFSDADEFGRAAGSSGTIYYKGFGTRIVTVDSGTQISIANSSPHNISTSSGTVTVWGWTTDATITVKGFQLEWDSVTSTHTTGLVLAKGCNFSQVTDLKTRDTTGSGIWHRYSYSSKFNQLDIHGPNAGIGAEYGIQSDGITLGVIDNSVFHTARHPVGYTGYPSALCRVQNSSLITESITSGHSFNAHSAESVTVYNCFLNDCAKFAGGTFIFKNCEIHSRINHNAGLFARRGHSHLKGLKVHNCIIRKKGGGAPGNTDHSGILYSSNPSITDGTQTSGNIEFIGNTIYNDDSQLLFFTGDGSTTDFNLPFYFASSSGFSVYLRDTVTNLDSTLTNPTHYSLSGAGTGSGTISLVTPPAADEIVVVHYGSMALIWMLNWDTPPDSYGDLTLKDNVCNGLFSQWIVGTGTGVPTSIISNPGTLRIIGNKITGGGIQTAASCFGLWKRIEYRGNSLSYPQETHNRPGFPAGHSIVDIRTGYAHDIIVSDNECNQISVFNQTSPVVVQNNVIAFQYEGGNLTGNNLIVLKDNITLRHSDSTAYHWHIAGATIRASGNLPVSGIKEFNTTAPSGEFIGVDTHYVGSGSTGARPTITSIGSVYFDTTLAASGKPIFRVGGIWVDADGSIV